MPDMFISNSSIDRLVRSVCERSDQSSPSIISTSEGEEFVNLIKRYGEKERSLQGLNINELKPVEEGINTTFGVKSKHIKNGCINENSTPDSNLGTHPTRLGKRNEILSVAQQMERVHISAECETTIGDGGDTDRTEGGNGKLETPCTHYNSIPSCPEDINLTSELLNKVAILRLNGGLGTSMGCKTPKSAIEVRNGQSFLDMAVQQVEFLNTNYGVDVPLILMNSFNTDEDTKRVLSRYEGRHVQVVTFKQSCYPRINKRTLLPIPTTQFDPKDRDLWFPPGHGDVYASLARCGLLENLISLGKEYIFISNIDNLGATVDLKILYHIMDNDFDFFMELAKKEQQDTKGGVLVFRKNKIELLEVNALPRAQGEALARDPCFDKFNTNNLWVNLRSLQSFLAAKKSIDLPVIARERMHLINGEELTSISFETAAGAAIALFDKVCAVVVPRDRFFPVKTTDDLFSVQSSHFIIKHGSLRFSAEHEKRCRYKHKVPTVKLGPCFRSVEEYKKRLPFGVPDIVELDHLTVSGDVRFRNNVVLKGTVIIVADEGRHIEICSGSLLRDKVITGHLNILPH